MSRKNTILKCFTFLFFLVFAIEVIAESFSYKPLILIFKPLIPLTLILMYIVESEKKNVVYIVLMFLSLLTNLLFIPNTFEALFYALVVFTMHRILVIFLIIRLNQIKDYIPVLIATAPFLIVFFYLYFETPELPESSLIILVLQNILISVFAGISLSDYVMNDNKQNSILLISAMLFVMLQFSIFIEKYYLNNEYSCILRPFSMSLNAMAFFTFYKYVLEAEKSNKN